MVNAQEYLEKKYPNKEERIKIEKLDIGHWVKLTGELDLNDFINLKELICWGNELTSLDLTKCEKLEKLDCHRNELTQLILPNNCSSLTKLNCYFNQLTNLNSSVLNPEKLKKLDIRSNNLSQSDLSVFTPLINLEVLKIGNWGLGIKERINQNIYNRFHGSLEPLQNMTKLRKLDTINTQISGSLAPLVQCEKLKKLDISDTDIDGGYEHLPASVEEFSFSNEFRPESKVKNIELEEQWKKRGLSWQQMHKWRNLGLELDDYAFATYLRNKGYEPDQENLDLEEWRTKWKISSKKSQEWLDEKYPKKERSEAKGIWLNEPSLEGELDLKDFTYEGYFPVCIYPEVDETKLKIKNLPKSAEISLFGVKKYINQKYPTKKEREKVEKLNIGCKNLRGELDFSDFVNLKELLCVSGELTSLNLSNCFHLTEFNCKDNLMTNIILPTNPTNLKKLDLSNNDFPPQDLSFLVPYTNLEELLLENNNFIGSLEPLRNMNKLKTLWINDTDIDHGLEYLPKSIDTFVCSLTWRPQSKVSDIWEELNPFEGENFAEKLKKWWEVKIDKKIHLTISPLLPPQLIKKESELFKFIKDKVKENRLIQKVDYKEIYFNLWPRNNEASSLKKLPNKLYNIEKDKVEKTKSNQDIKDYAILSYVWGKERKLIELFNDTSIFKTQYKDELNPSGYKSLYKSIETCKILGINHLWIDQLCINQTDNEEKAQEVSKMRQYYSNASITLISLNNEIGNLSDANLIDVLEFITSSRWFTRSWTFQEGWLSKHTIFMLDDKLVDGRAIAGTWALNQLGYANEGRYLSRREFEKGTKKIATPVGWTYYRYDYDENDKVEMRLYQALKAIKSRKRSVPVDGIYSILGLLPYGEQVKVDYSKNNTPEKTLKNIMKVATTNGYAEPLAWHGASNTSLGLCWMPQIDEYGSTNVEGGIDIKMIKEYSETFVDFQEEGITLTRFDTHTIEEANSNIHKLEGGFEIDSGLYRREVKLRKINEADKGKNEVLLLGTKETLTLAEKGKYLVVFNRQCWISNRPFALLVENTGKNAGYEYDENGRRFDNYFSVYHRLGLVELGNEKLQGGFHNPLIIGNNFSNTQQLSTLTNRSELKLEYQVQIEILPKNS